MTKAQFEALMPMMVSDLAGMIARELLSIPEEEAVMSACTDRSFTRTSRTRRRRCGITARQMLYTLFDEELRTGKIEYPDV